MGWCWGDKEPLWWGDNKGESAERGRSRLGGRLRVPRCEHVPSEVSSTLRVTGAQQWGRREARKQLPWGASELRRAWYSETENWERAWGWPQGVSYRGEALRGQEALREWPGPGWGRGSSSSFGRGLAAKVECGEGLTAMGTRGEAGAIAGGAQWGVSGDSSTVCVCWEG